MPEPLSDEAVRCCLTRVLEWAKTHGGKTWKWGAVVLQALTQAIERYGVCECPESANHAKQAMQALWDFIFCPLCGRRLSKEVPHAE